MFNTWRSRAEKAEALVAVMTKQLAMATDHLANRPTLTSLTQSGRLNKFVFSRNGKSIVVETYSTMEDDFNEWHNALLGGTPDGDQG